ncbi:hypothetical protein [Marinobacter sp. BGYM27]|uniref:hypothetical protein n=1 Tax=Marinobacter sp. BGYM27 TaxID=2975597 RepID=UPI0021A2F078|nr:hypothetical protein [Marinobacter sp. BGYM27]MDG5499623.1 hypothetical protein [Marinobacter sp. BGYM27]
MKFVVLSTLLTVLCLSAPVTQADEPGKPPLLREGASSKSYELVFIGDSFLAEISYSREDDFFLVQDDHFRVIDTTGHQRFALERESTTHRVPMTHYVATSEGIYDLSKTGSVFQPFAARINDDPSRTLTVDSWRGIFGELYDKADVVVYGREPDFDLVRFPAYLRVDGRWVVVYIPTRVDVQDNFYLGSTMASFPARFSRMTYLKSPATGAFAADNYQLRNSAGLLPEDDLTYRQPGKLDWVSFRKEDTLDSTYYLGIPLSHTGPAVHELTIQGETMRFRENAVKPLLGQPEANIHWFTLPERLADRTQVSFLEFTPGNNVSSQGSDGVYVLRPKKPAR